MVRCTLSSSTPIAHYTFPYNPVVYESNDETKLKAVDLLHGSPAWQKSKFDGGLRTLRWEGYDATSTTVKQMIAEFKLRQGKLYYINFYDMDDLNNQWPTTDDWKKIRLIDVRTKPRRGGPLVYEYIELLIQPEE